VRCQELLQALNEHLDGETQSALCRAFREHLAGCVACRVVIDNIHHTIAVYRGGELLPMPAGLHERIRSLMQDRWTAGHRQAGDN
jgi:predicted anti-sigma-YlaC factor YlaD